VRRRLAAAAAPGLVVALAVAAVAAGAVAGGRTTVPQVTQLDLQSAYAKLHHAGLRVSFRGSVSDGWDGCLPFVKTESPAAGARVPMSTAVTLVLLEPKCGMPSPAVPPGRLRKVLVPEFIGDALPAAIAWTEHNELSWSGPDLPPLTRADAPTLLANYLVIDQSPKAGRRLADGIEGPAPGSFTPTPLVLHVTVRR
jgi:hypothetical protein